MADLIDDIDVELADPPAAEPKVEAEKAPPAAQKEALSPEEGIKRLEANLASERARREEADRRAAQATQERHQAQVEVVDTNMALVNSAIANCEQAKETLTARYAEAAAAGDWGSASEVQSLMADNAAALSQLRTGKQAMEAQGRPQAPQAQQYQNPDPVEAYVSQLGGYPRSAAWVRQHPEFVTDQRLNSKMISAHNLAVADGLQPDSDDYFTAIESTLRLAPTTTVAIGEEPQTRAPPAAPPSRGSGANGSKPGTVRLTPAQVEAAEMCGMSIQEYAEQVVALEKDRKEGLN